MEPKRDSGLRGGTDPSPCREWAAGTRPEEGRKDRVGRLRAEGAGGC